MRSRCTNPNRGDFYLYGGRGITVCEQWRTFAGFLADMGERPVGTTLERINPNGHYEPSNCKWATIEEQSNNKRRNIRVMHEGKTLTVRQWERELGLKKCSLGSLLKTWGSIQGVLDRHVGRCLECGREYTRTSGSQKFCNTNCGQNYRHMKKVMRYPGLSDDPRGFTEAEWLQIINVNHEELKQTRNAPERNTESDQAGP